ncbi:CatB-related O-acetyltransferase [Stenotrophomonas maltophilia]|uniref:CatB-related O-acetyltransferase n=1 Tax=Stenotrophomonas TaxID=40323 RepID=UPI0006C4D680|nr:MULTISPECIES: CatB-related O-acetyltransferase [Stenotrophomonas]KAA3599454.1 antibiotic acetyltransferase [Stenotrophomonas maltophilia]KOO77587.1 chloramphenicol acetyltransferase [Stenotrophomonas maltophilia]MBN5126267.1 CatB-related O-acetyltransferase [Stenotrophomonas maltophilia]MBN5176417.1 CatB-related O-acetyltransferase [Stenotrophomonas maltophilia]MCU1121527.1 CatB-related O-acetyltransferase [Stenotrophomonas maltophilia]
MTGSLIPETVVNDPRIQVGRFTYGNPNFRIWAEHESIIIGAFCSIADEVAIFGGGEHNAQWVTTFPLRIALGHPDAHADGHPATRGPTRIGNDVWIGHGATIMSGVTVGNGAIIGARAVVAKDVPPFAVVVGNPARIVRYRFTDAQIQALQQIQWWNWPLEKISEMTPLLCGGSVEQFIASAQTKEQQENGR